MSMSRGAILTRCSGNCSQRTPNKWYIPLLTEVMDNSESKSFEQGVKKIINNTPSLVSNPSPPSLPPSLHLSLPPSLPLSLSLPPSLPPPLTSSSVLGWLQGSLKVPWKVERDLKESKKAKINIDNLLVNKSWDVETVGILSSTTQLKDLKKRKEKMGERQKNKPQYHIIDKHMATPYTDQ